MLSSIDHDFYAKVADLLNRLKAEIGTGFSLQKVREYENALKVAMDIYEVREQKILLRALRAARGKNNLTGLADIEKILYDNLVKEITTREVEFEKSLGAEQRKVETATSETTDAPKQKDIGRKLKILLDVPQFVGADGEKQGPFKPGEVVYLPDKEGELLIKRKLAEDV